MLFLYYRIIIIIEYHLFMEEFIQIIKKYKWWIIGIILVYFGIQSQSPKNSLSYKKISEISCENHVKIWANGQKISNRFGKEYEILSLKNVKEVSKSKTELVCKGKGIMSSGDDTELILRIYDDEEDNSRYYEIKTSRD